MTDVAAAMKSRVVTPRVAKSALKTSEAKVYAIPSEQGTYTAAIVPIGAGYSLTSNFTVLFDEKGSIVQYTETHVSENAAGTSTSPATATANSSAARTQTCPT
jgi:hypothetical protein